MTDRVRSLILGIAVLVTAASAGFARAQAPSTAATGGLPPIIDRDLFFGDPEIAGAQISPDGQYIAFLKPFKGTRNRFGGSGWRAEFGARRSLVVQIASGAMPCTSRCKRASSRRSTGTDKIVTGPFSAHPDWAVTGQPRSHRVRARCGSLVTMVTPIIPGVNFSPATSPSSTPNPTPMA